jgi:hypothetical protein
LTEKKSRRDIERGLPLWKSGDVLSDGVELWRSNSNQWIPSSLWIGVESVRSWTASFVVSRGELGVEVGGSSLSVQSVDEWIDESEWSLSSVYTILVEESDKTGNEWGGCRGSSNKRAWSRSAEKTDLLSNSSNIWESSVGLVEQGARWKSDSTFKICVNSSSLVSWHCGDLRETTSGVESSSIGGQSWSLDSAGRAVTSVRSIGTDWWGRSGVSLGLGGRALDRGGSDSGDVWRSSWEDWSQSFTVVRCSVSSGCSIISSSGKESVSEKSKLHELSVGSLNVYLAVWNVEI